MWISTLLSGLRYCRPRSSPQCRHITRVPTQQWLSPHFNRPILSPRLTWSPIANCESMGSYVERSWPCLITTTPRPAISLAKVMTPFSGATTTCPERARKSTPRCPGSQLCMGGSKARAMLGAGVNGNCQYGLG